MSYKALLIGVNEYHHSQDFRNLDAVSNDINAMTRLLMNSPCQYQPTVVTGKNATHQRIQKELQHFFDCNIDDILFLFWAGHGLGSRLVAYDTDPKNVVATGIEIKMLNEMIENAVSEAVVVVLDSCFSGSIARSGANFQLDIRGKGRVIMASSDYLEESYDSESGYGRFTECFLRGMSGEGDAVSTKGEVTVARLHEFICEQIKEYEPRKIQTPVLKATLAGTFVLNRVSPPPRNQTLTSNSNYAPNRTENLHGGRGKVNGGYNMNELLQDIIPISFTDIDKHNFMKESYNYIREGLLTALEGIKQKRADFDYTYEDITSKKVSFKYFLNGKGVGGFTIWLDNTFGSSRSVESIQLLYGFSSGMGGNSCNEIINCEQNESGLFLKMTMDFSGRDELMDASAVIRTILKNNIAPILNTQY